MADNASPAQPKTRSAGDGHILGKPEWKSEARNAYEQHKRDLVAWRNVQSEKRLAALRDGARIFKVALMKMKDGEILPNQSPLKVLNLGKPVDYLEVGASTEVEAKEKFAKYNGIRGVPQQIYVVA